jgi:pSer/pThr/pTyr-binding forkhead associated (FHA) protein
VPAYKLISTTGDQTFEVPPSGTMNVGRAVTSDIPVYDPTVSRNHAEISASENGITVKDLGSSNGTFVNGNRITEETVSHGDVVTFGKVAFKVREVTLAQAVVPPEEKDQSFPSTQPEATIIRQLPVRESGGFAQAQRHLLPQGVRRVRGRATGDEAQSPPRHLEGIGEAAGRREAA